MKRQFVLKVSAWQPFLSKREILPPVLLVGCQDGTIREFDLSVLLSSKQPKGASTMKCGHYYEVPGPCHRPRRVFSISEKEQAIRHVTAPNHVGLTNNSILLYALVDKNPSKQKDTSSKLSKFSLQLIRVTLPMLDCTQNTTRSFR